MNKQQKQAEKLPVITIGTVDTFSDTAKEITTYIEGRQLEQAEPLLLLLLNATESSARSYETEKRWHEAWKYTWLFVVQLVKSKAAKITPTKQRNLWVYFTKGCPFHSCHPTTVPLRTWYLMICTAEEWRSFWNKVCKSGNTI